MTNVVNLNQFRKTKKKVEKRAQAKENREKFGRTKSEKSQSTAEIKRSENELDGKKLEPESSEET